MWVCVCFLFSVFILFISTFLSLFYFFFLGNLFYFWDFGSSSCKVVVLFFDPAVNAKLHLYYIADNIRLRISRVQYAVSNLYDMKKNPFV